VKAAHVPVTRGDCPTYPGMEGVKQPGQLGAADFLRWASLVLNDDSFTKQADSHKELAAPERFARLGLRPIPESFKMSALRPCATPHP
jgi:hypothetical protein